MRKKIRILLLVLIVSVFANTVNFPIVNAENLAEENELQLTEGEKTNFNFIKTLDFSDIVYTYEQDGKTYIVYECANEGLSVINTEIYELRDGEEYLVEELITYVEKENSNMEISQYRNGLLIENSNINLIGEGLEEIVNPNDLGTGVYNGYLYYVASTGNYYTAWEYAYNYKGSTELGAKTLTTVSSIIINLVGGYYGLPDIAIDAAENMAEYIIEENWDYIYWKGKLHEAHQVTYPARKYYGSYIGTYTYLELTDSTYKYVETGDWFEWHDPETWPSSLKITTFSESSGY